MSWAKRNLYFLLSGILAVVLLAAAGWYCYSSWQSNSANGDQLKQAYDQLKQIAGKNPGAGNDKVNNIEAAREQTKEVRARVAEMEKFFIPVRGIPNTNHFEDRLLAFAVRDTVGQLRASAQSHGVALPTPEFAFSFTLQVGKATYEANSGPMLSKQLGEIKVICDTLYASRIASLDAIQREHTSDDVSGANAYAAPTGGNDYCDSGSMTNDNMIITPYQVTFQCFTPELGVVLASFANQSHTVVVKTLNLQPADLAVGSYTSGAYATFPTYQAGGAVSYPPNAGQPAPVSRGGLPSAIDEKKLKVTMLLDFVKIVPAQGR